jgi:hypothetical protein|tara:strand:- start:969 stop:1238 length:270 start_codon:yes stop_codon:yes gene_type:complete
MQKEYTHHHDKAHGWLEVPVSDCFEIGLEPDDFSAFSYRDGDTLYLEEDCDMPKFMTTCIVKTHALPVIGFNRADNTTIRNMEGVKNVY